MTQHVEPTDSVAEFAHDLRDLRLKAGDPTLTALQSKTGISKSVISEALIGRRLPTQRTVGHLVEALGGDRTRWLERRAKLDRYAASQTVVSEQRASGPMRRVVPLRAAIAVSAACTLLAVVITSILWSTFSPPSPTAPEVASAGEEYLDYADGVDPMQTICREDAVIAASEERLDGAVLVQMMYSNQCMAVWGRVTRYDGEAAGNSLSMLIYPATNLESERNQERSAFDVQSIYTTLMIEPDVDARVCGIASTSTAATLSSEPMLLGPPLCI